mgnify:CR=1 FL=1
MSGRLDPSMSARRANSQQAFVRRRVDEGHERARLGGRHNRRPLERRLDRRADEAHLVAVVVGQKLAARERVIDVLEVPRLVVAEAADGERGGDAALPRARPWPRGSSGDRCTRSADRVRTPPEVDRRA